MDGRFANAKGIDTTFDNGPDSLDILGGGRFTVFSDDVVNQVGAALKVQSEVQPEERVVAAAIELKVEHLEIDARNCDEDSAQDDEHRYQNQTS